MMMDVDAKWFYDRRDGKLRAQKICWQQRSCAKRGEISKEFSARDSAAGR